MFAGGLPLVNLGDRTPLAVATRIRLLAAGVSSMLPSPSSTRRPWGSEQRELAGGSGRPSLGEALRVTSTRSSGD